MDRALIRGGEDFIAEFLDPKEYVTAHTSGSTGAPKEIRLLKADMLASAEATCRFFGITGQSYMACPLSTDYIAGKMMVVRALASGCRLDIIKPSASPLEHWRGSQPIDLLPVVPSQIEPLLADTKIASVRNLLIGGGAISPSLEARLIERNVRAWASYGMTETCSHVALRPVGTETYTAMDGITFATDARDCLIVNAPKMSVKRIVTNDIVALHSPTRFRWLGRYDNVINSGGIKIHPEVDERLLAPHLPQTEFYLTGRASDRWGTEIVMIVLSSPLADSEIIAICRNILPRYHVPKEIIREHNPLLTESGKIIRRKL